MQILNIQVTELVIDLRLREIKTASRNFVLMCELDVEFWTTAGNTVQPLRRYHVESSLNVSLSKVEKEQRDFHSTHGSNLRLRLNSFLPSSMIRGIVIPVTAPYECTATPFRISLLFPRWAKRPRTYVERSPWKALGVSLPRTKNRTQCDAQRCR